ncbi:6005_t:CDS:1, partial [Dentiscutata erythropus]
ESDNVQKTYFDENKQISFNYPQGFDQFFPSEYNILGLDSSNQIQFPLTSYGFNEWQSTDKLETPPSVSAYGEQSTGKLENSSELVDHSVHSVENVEKPNTLINEKQQSEKLVNLDYESLWSLIT